MQLREGYVHRYSFCTANAHIFVQNIFYLVMWREQNKYHPSLSVNIYRLFLYLEYVVFLVGDASYYIRYEILLSDTPFLVKYHILHTTFLILHTTFSIYTTYYRFHIYSILLLITHILHTPTSLKEMFKPPLHSMFINAQSIFSFKEKYVWMFLFQNKKNHILPIKRIHKLLTKNYKYTPYYNKEYGRFLHTKKNTIYLHTKHYFLTSMELYAKIFSWYAYTPYSSLMLILHTSYSNFILTLHTSYYNNYMLILQLYRIMLHAVKKSNIFVLFFIKSKKL